MKTVTIVIPTYDEEKNIPLIYQRILAVFERYVNKYLLEILFIDNRSRDRSRDMIIELAKSDSRVKAIFNAQNFGFTRSSFYGLTQATGDCAILLFADMQDPPEIIPEFIKRWEANYKIVVGIKNKSQENRVMYFIRSCYYKVMKNISEAEHITQFDGFGLYDRAFLEVLKKLDDPMPYLRGIVGELGFQRSEVHYQQLRRTNGSSSFSFFKMYDFAMLGITSYSKFCMRLATLIGFTVAFISLLFAGYNFIYKLLHWETYPAGFATIIISIFFFGSVQLIFIGLLSEYIMTMNTRVLHRPLVIEERRINF